MEYNFASLQVSQDHGQHGAATTAYQYQCFSNNYMFCNTSVNAIRREAIYVHKTTMSTKEKNVMTYQFRHRRTQGQLQQCSQSTWNDQLVWKGIHGPFSSRGRCCRSSDWHPKITHINADKHEIIHRLVEPPDKWSSQRAHEVCLSLCELISHVVRTLSFAACKTQWRRKNGLHMDAKRSLKNTCADISLWGRIVTGWYRWWDRHTQKWHWVFKSSSFVSRWHRPCFVIQKKTQHMYCETSLCEWSVPCRTFRKGSARYAGHNILLARHFRRQFSAAEHKEHKARRERYFR